MGFGLNSNITGDFLPIVKIDARTGRIVRVDRDEGGEQRLGRIRDASPSGLPLPPTVSERRQRAPRPREAGSRRRQKQPH